MVVIVGSFGTSKGIGGRTGGEEVSNSVRSLRNAEMEGLLGGSSPSSTDWSSMARVVGFSRSTMRSYKEHRSQYKILRACRFNPPRENWFFLLLALGGQFPKRSL